ncbi:MAG: DUF3410 domain-containing protein, partial [Marinobacter sp.]|nr:DUF3410 domain-containing protein [Marinobacter sp.]
KKAGQFLPEPPLSKMTFTAAAEEQKALRTALRACYDPRTDDVKLRLAMKGDASDRAEAFDDLRRNYPVRRECSSLKVQLKGAGRSMQDSFKAVGFKLKI